MQYTIRNIPPAVDAALRRRARARGKSLNQIALEELSKAAGEDRLFDDLDFLAGSWIADTETDEALADQAASMRRCGVEDRAGHQRLQRRRARRRAGHGVDSTRGGSADAVRRTGGASRRVSGRHGRRRE